MSAISRLLIKYFWALVKRVVYVRKNMPSFCLVFVPRRVERLVRQVLTRLSRTAQILPTEIGARSNAHHEVWMVQYYEIFVVSLVAVIEMFSASF